MTSTIDESKNSKSLYGIIVLCFFFVACAWFARVFPGANERFARDEAAAMIERDPRVSQSDAEEFSRMMLGYGGLTGKGWAKKKAFERDTIIGWAAVVLALAVAAFGAVPLIRKHCCLSILPKVMWGGIILQVCCSAVSCYLVPDIFSYPSIIPAIIILVAMITSTACLRKLPNASKLRNSALASIIAVPVVAVSIMFYVTHEQMPAKKPPVEKQSEGKQERKPGEADAGLGKHQKVKQKRMKEEARKKMSPEEVIISEEINEGFKLYSKYSRARSAFEAGPRRLRFTILKRFDDSTYEILHAGKNCILKTSSTKYTSTGGANLSVHYRGIRTLKGKSGFPMEVPLYEEALDGNGRSLSRDKAFDDRKKLRKDLEVSLDKVLGHLVDMDAKSKNHLVIAEALGIKNPKGRDLRVMKSLVRSLRSYLNFLHAK